MEPVTIILCALIVMGTFFFWEFVAWFTHKYVMHGFLWVWHKSHHTVHHHALERNDWFAVVFSVPSIASIYYGAANQNPYIVSVGIGIFCYGLFYLVFHDIVVHQRLKWKPFRSSRYLKRMINAHYVHHSRHSKEGCESFGFLIVRKKYEPKNFLFKQNREETQ